jgi:hypothetical protein
MIKSLSNRRSRISVLKQSPRNVEHKYYYTKGFEFSLNGENYIGEYHYDNGVPMTGPINQEFQSEILRRYYSNPDHYEYDRLWKFQPKPLLHVDPVPYLYKPAPGVYVSGRDARYFVEKIYDDLSYAMEIDQRQYQKIGTPGGIDSSIYHHTSITWTLTGKRDDIIAANEKALLDASAIVPSIQYGVRNYLEFAQITLV